MIYLQEAGIATHAQDHPPLPPLVTRMRRFEHSFGQMAQQHREPSWLAKGEFEILYSYVLHWPRKTQGPFRIKLGVSWSGTQREPQHSPPTSAARSEFNKVLLLLVCFSSKASRKQPEQRQDENSRMASRHCLLNCFPGSCLSVTLWPQAGPGATGWKVSKTG